MGFPNRMKTAVWAVAFICLLFLLSCQPAPTPLPTPTTVSTPTPGVILTSTPTPEPLASEKNPLILGIVADPADSKISQAASDLANQISQITAFTIKSKIVPSYQLLVSEMSSGKIHLAFLPPLTYLYSTQQGFAKASLVSNHLGVFQYGFRFFSNVSSKFTSFYDPRADRSTAGAASALKQLQDKRPCWVENGSPSGHIAPAGTLAGENILVKPGAFLGSPTSLIRALYINGICDFGATFATTGDPRTSPTVQQDLTDVINRVVILWQSEPIIPNLNLSLYSKLKDDMREDLTFAVQSLLRSTNGKNALASALNYEVQDFRPVTDSFYQPLLSLVNAAKFDLNQLIGK